MSENGGPEISDEAAARILRQALATKSFVDNWKLWRPVIETFVEEFEMTRLEAIAACSFITLCSTYMLLSADAAARAGFTKRVLDEMNEGDEWEQ